MSKIKRVDFDFDSPFKLSFGDFWLSRQLDLTWKVLLEEFKEEWIAIFEIQPHEDELEDQDIIFYELKFSSSFDVETDLKNFSLDSVTLDFTYDEEEEGSEVYAYIPDDFEFDVFFFDYFILLMIFSFFFFPFFLLELSYFAVFIFYTQTFMLINDPDDDKEKHTDFFDFLTNESDISHYFFADFHFEKFLTFNEMFYYSGFWKNKPYSKHIKILKSIK